LLRAAVLDNRFKAIGVWGGDGSAGAAASVAVEHGLPLVVFPGGTMNHFARDIHVPNLPAVVAAVQNGQGLFSDVGLVRLERGLAAAPQAPTLTMLNTASVGIYPSLVRRRELIQDELGKPLAGLLAGLRTFTFARPTWLLIDGHRRRLWTLYLGRGRYYPMDMAPLERPVLDDGLLDIRMLDAGEPFARLRLLAAMLIGRVATSRVTHLDTSEQLTVEAVQGTLLLSVDGEVVEGVRKAEFSVQRRLLRVYSPGLPFRQRGIQDSSCPEGLARPVLES
jgi:undecaprenyl-diphosphatase